MKVDFCRSWMKQKLEACRGMRGSCTPCDEDLMVVNSIIRFRPGMPTLIL